jgi:hypothetical protein
MARLNGAPQNASGFDEIPVNGYGVLRNGLQVWKWIARDCYAGTKEGLILAGIAQADWFPSVPIPPGARLRSAKRAFTVKAAAGRIKVIVRTSRKWEIDIPVSEEERSRREREHDRQIKAERDALRAEEERQEEQEDAGLRKAITLAPQVAPSSLSEAELHHIRLLRTVNYRTRSNILGFTERLMLADARYGDLAERQLPQLVLAIDNTRAGQ